jgi:hypothetical protein
MSLAYKYESELSVVRTADIQCPPEDLTEPENLLAYRFVFTAPSHVKNHKPVGIHNPKRVLSTEGAKKCFLYSLSCFTDKEGAKTFFVEMKQVHKNFEKSVGDSLAEGILGKDDGHISAPGYKTHFELFESKNCDLSKKFAVVEALV